MTQPTRLEALLAAGAFGPGTGACEVIETHLSWVVLTADVAYKVKKPVNLGFVDFTTLEARRRACEAELRLNRRLAPDIYLDVVALRLSARAAAECGGPEIEYAVRMRRFPPGSAVGAGLASSMTVPEAVQLGRTLAEFHRGLPPSGVRGGPEAVWAAIGSSLEQLAGLLHDAAAQDCLSQCRRFLAEEFARCQALMAERQRGGAVRECHGDLHLGNVVRLGTRLVPFDALEFDPELRWIDVMNEVAFLVMDLEVRGRRDLAFHALNAYLEVTGDFAGLATLRLYLSYRALVRAKVLALAPGPAAGGDPDAQALLRYCAAPLPGVAGLLVVMSGVSGSGKSWLATRLAALLPAIHLRSDVERKRRFGLPPLAHTGAAGPGAGIYAPAISAAVYERMAALGEEISSAGLAVILDATSLRREHRARFLSAARRAGCPAVIVSCVAPEHALTERVARREREGGDASEASLAVLRRQQQEFEPVLPDEARAVFTIDTAAAPDVAVLAWRIRVAAGLDK